MKVLIIPHSPGDQRRNFSIPATLSTLCGLTPLYGNVDLRRPF